MLSKITRLIENQFATLSPQLLILSLFSFSPMGEGLRLATNMMIILGAVSILRLAMNLKNTGRIIKSNMAVIAEVGTIGVNLAIISQNSSIVSPNILITGSLLCAIIFAFTLVTRTLFILNLALLGHEKLAERRVELILSGPSSLWPTRLMIVRDYSMKMSEKHRINGSMVLEKAEKALTKAEKSHRKSDEYR